MSNNSRMRVSTASGRRRVTTTSGLRFNDDMFPPDDAGPLSRACADGLLRSAAEGRLTLP
ncbi:hypothetical protein GCM10008965_56190 [Methylorubrum aminovorans]|nr:hypothetical protein GCM10025880_31810 [Methylorubrum aminovorans]